MHSRSLRSARALCLVALGVFLSTRADAQDHLDGTIASNPAADLGSLYAWMDGGAVVLALTVYPSAPAGAHFSATTQYAFHLSSRTALASGAPQAEEVICTFDASQVAQCWGGGEYVRGDAGAAAGLSSADGKLKVYAGLRADPETWNRVGFNATVAAVQAASPSLTFDAGGCPAVGAAVSGALVNQLAHDGSGGPPTNGFASQNVLALVVRIDKALVTSGGPVLGVWASTHAVP